MSCSDYGTFVVREGLRVKNCLEVAIGGIGGVDRISSCRSHLRSVLAHKFNGVPFCIWNEWRRSQVGVLELAGGQSSWRRRGGFPHRKRIHV